MSPVLVVIVAYVVIVGFLWSLCKVAGDADERALSNYEAWRAER